MVSAQGKGTQKIDQLRRAVEQEPSSAQAHFRLGTALLRVSTKEAELTFRRAVELDPKLAEAWVNLGGILLARLDHDGCIDANKHAVEARPDLMHAHFNKGLGHLYKGQPEEMADCFRRVIELEANHAGGHYYLAVALYALGLLDDAKASLKRAMNLGYSPEPSFLNALNKEPDGGVSMLEFDPSSLPRKS